jgi:hypothetical protein
MEGVLRLPWRPSLPVWHGTTTYYRDDNGLIYRHAETWELSVAQAFLKTLWPALADRLWREDDDGSSMDGETLQNSEEECVL